MPLGKFHSDVALAVAVRLLNHAGGILNDIKLAKLQYLVERTCLLKRHAPLTGDDGVSLFHGPCLSRSLNLATEYEKSREWGETVSFAKFGVSPAAKHENVVLLRTPSTQFGPLLSPAESAIVDEVWEKFGSMSKREIRSWCHENCPEHIHVRQGQRQFIDWRNVFLAEGMSESEANEIVDQIRYLSEFEIRYGA